MEVTLFVRILPSSVSIGMASECSFAFVRPSLVRGDNDANTFISPPFTGFYGVVRCALVNALRATRSR